MLDNIQVGTVIKIPDQCASAHVETVSLKPSKNFIKEAIKGMRVLMFSCPSKRVCVCVCVCVRACVRVCVYLLLRGCPGVFDSV